MKRYNARIAAAVLAVTMTMSTCFMSNASESTATTTTSTEQTTLIPATEASSDTSSENPDSSTATDDDKKESSESSTEASTATEDSSESTTEATTEEQPVQKEQCLSTSREFYYELFKSKKTFKIPVKNSGNGKLVFTSSKPSVATVSSKGVVTMKKRGKCSIIVYAKGNENYKRSEEISIPITLYSLPKNLGYSSSYKSGKYYKKLKALRFTGTYRDSMLAIARSQIGYKEGSSRKRLSGLRATEGNYTEYSRYYGMNGVAWCAIFVNWCARENGISKSVIPKYCAVRQYWAYYRNHAHRYSWTQVRTGKYTPEKGDLIFYSNVRGGTTHHIGYVLSVERSGSKITITTVEGNQDDAVRKVVMKMSKSSVRGKVNGHYITGFASPNY